MQCNLYPVPAGVHVNKQAIGYFCLFLDTMGSVSIILVRSTYVSV